MQAEQIDNCLNDTQLYQWKQPGCTKGAQRVRKGLQRVTKGYKVSYWARM